ncbi:MAG TPA: M28 family peptidase [Streptosporangiaceae bacterium]|nr:M28 family peptidase [Streptosporangiaceae bacterium]
MKLAELVAAIYEAFDADLALADVHAICEHDRYQASAGIMAAAAYVAEQARAAGLSDVAVLTFPADGAKRWWTYHSPRSWTPVKATLHVGGTVLVSYPDQPYSLAAYSAPMRSRTLPLVRYSAVRAGAADPHGAMVVADEPVPLGVLAGPMAAAGAAAIAADPLSEVPHRFPEQVGRLELAPGSELAAFSVTPAQLSHLASAADAGALAQVNIELDPAISAMPVVTGRLPASGPDDGTEVLLSAHLCHPRPGANDNASGVAALLGIARTLAAARQTAVDSPPTTTNHTPAITTVGPTPTTTPSHTTTPNHTTTPSHTTTRSHTTAGPAPTTTALRFLWGPEFVGTVAYLHEVVGSGLAPAAWLAINIDMAGQDVARCGGPLVIERGPDDIGSFLPALATRCATLLPAASRSYSGAVPCEPWTWRETPFAGGSDHALLADQATQVIGLGHWPDRANHSSADTPDLVDPEELKRTAVIAAACVAAVSGSGDPELAGDLAQATIDWAAQHVLAVLPGRRVPLPSRVGEPVLDPLDELNAARWLRHRGAVALEALAAVAALRGVDAGWLRSAQAWITSLIELTAARLPSLGKAEPQDAQSPLVRCWEGPSNLRALAGDACPADREWLNERLAEDRGGNYARALAMMRGVNGKRDRTELSWWAALSSELPITLSFAGTFADLMGRAGWTRTDSQAGQP